MPGATIFHRRRQEGTAQANPSRKQPSAASYALRPPPPLGQRLALDGTMCLRQSLQRADGHHGSGQQCKARRHAGNDNIEREKSLKQPEARATYSPGRKLRGEQYTPMGATLVAPGAATEYGPSKGATLVAPRAASKYWPSNVAPSSADAPHHPRAQGKQPVPRRCYQEPATAASHRLP